MKRRILLVDDEAGDFADAEGSAGNQRLRCGYGRPRRARRSMKIRGHEYHMVITDMRMESANAGMRRWLRRPRRLRTVQRLPC